jgi:hypothetical protein
MKSLGNDGVECGNVRYWPEADIQLTRSKMAANLTTTADPTDLTGRGLFLLSDSFFAKLPLMGIVE